MGSDLAFRAVVLFAATWTLMASGGGGGTSPVSNSPVPPTTPVPEFFRHDFNRGFDPWFAAAKLNHANGILKWRITGSRQ